MTSNLYFIILFFISNGAFGLEGFNYTSPYEIEAGIHRDGKFLFDALFGLEVDDDVATNTATNTLKSCDCGKIDLNFNSHWIMLKITHDLELLI